MYVYSYIESGKRYYMDKLKSVDDAFRLAIWDREHKIYRHSQYVYVGNSIYGDATIRLYKKVYKIGYYKLRPKVR